MAIQVWWPHVREKVEVGCETVNFDPSGRQQPMEELPLVGLKFYQHENTDMNADTNADTYTYIQI